MQVIAKVGGAVDITYQAKNCHTGLVNVTMKIYDETRAPDLVNFPNVVMTEIGATGRYHGSFTPDNVGVWTVTVDSATKSSPMVETVIVSTHDLDVIGSAITALNDLSELQVQAVVDGAKLDILTALSDIGQPAMLG